MLKEFSLKGSIFGAQYKKFADLPNKEELVSKFAMMLNSPMSKFASTINAPMQNLAGVLHKLKQTKS